ncbi:hypothetical protein RI367_000279 [Sorochytrium milnesiophthora]
MSLLSKISTWYASSLTMELPLQLQSLPPELRQHILCIAGPETCIHFRDVAAVQTLLRADGPRDYRVSALGAVLTRSCVDHWWSAGLQALIQHGIHDILTLPSSELQHVQLQAVDLERLWQSVPSLVRYRTTADRKGVYRTLASLIYTSHVGDISDPVTHWCTMDCRDLAIALGEQLIAHGGTLRQLQSLCSRAGVECDIATYATQAASCGQTTLLQQLLRLESNASVDIEELQTAAAAGDHLGTLQYLCTSSPPTLHVMDQATAAGALAAVEWMSAEHAIGCSAWAVETAAKRGHGDVVRLLHCYGHTLFSTSVMDAAAEGGHLALLHWLHRHRSEGCSPVAMDLAASNGHLRVLKWLHSHRSEGATCRAVEFAAAAGHTQVVQWLVVNRQLDCHGSHALDKALASGHLDLARWLMQHHVPKLPPTPPRERLSAGAAM